MTRIILSISVIMAAAGPSTAWAVCEGGTDAERLDCLSAELSATQAELAELLTYLSVDTAANSVTFTGANVFVRSGSGATDGAVNGLGNLIVGYGEDAPYFSSVAAPAVRTGSHNLVVGGGASYSSFGGFVGGLLNRVTGEFGSVSVIVGARGPGADASIRTIFATDGTPFESIANSM